MLSHLIRASASVSIVAGALLATASSAGAARTPVFVNWSAFYNVNPESPYSACKWHVVASANPFPDQNYLASVSASSSRDAWAVGATLDTNAGTTEPLVERWAGSAWSIVTTPSLVSGLFNGVVEISPTDAWAVGGYYDPTSSRFHTLAEHWDGSSWTAIATPNPGSLTNGLISVAANSTSDVWAVGSYKVDASGTRATLTEHWDGSSWSVVPSPNVGSDDSVLDTVVANGKKNVWADGGYNCHTGTCQTLTERWNGTKWKIIPSPNVNSNSNPLNTMTSTGPNDIWALGDYYTGTTFNTLAEHWNGSAWSIVPSANMGFTAILGSTSVNTHDVWAVGEWVNGSILQPFSMNWNGTAWTAVAAPNVGASGSILQGASLVPHTTSIWAVGSSLNSDTSPHVTLIEKFHC
jgi:hypothetical protein